MKKLDSIDRQLLKLLQEDASTPLNQLAAKVNLSPTPCWRRIERLKEAGIITRQVTLLDPTKDPLGKGFHTLQGMIAIGSGGIEGKGFMKGTQTHLEFIPERTTDFIFAAYSEEFGLAGNLFLIVCFLLLVWRGLAIAVGATSLFGRLMAGAVSMIFFTYAFVNMGMVSGILPVVGVPLPFISYGGTAMVTLGLALGILMSVARAQKQDTKDPRAAL